MYLKALEIQGFKSFPEKTHLSFEKDITVIVGPNGSGKSNISDALLWVMGEQKSRMLRGGKMEDVIFGGTEKRGAMGFAEVTLILDNSTRLLRYEADEVSISRRYYRSGDSEYYINKQQVRLRDITDLLMDTGLGTDGYSIIGQGRISEIVSARSTDRREIFEEAAGIARFRSRKEESERKLAHTEENLLRIGDKISELELQVGPLKQQSETAKKYLLLRDELREKEVSFWMASLDRLTEQAALLKKDCDKAVEDCKAARSDQERLYAESERLAERMREIDTEAEADREELRRTESNASDCESEAAVLRTNLANNEETLRRLEREIGDQNERADALSVQIAEHRKRMDEITAECLRLAGEAGDLRRRELDNTSGREDSSRRLAELASRESELNAALAENKTAVSMLEEALAGLEERKRSADDERAAAEARLQDAENTLSEQRKKLNEAKEKEQSLSNVISGHNMLMSGREKRASDLQERRTKLTVDLQSAQSRLRLLSDLEREMEGLSRASKTVMQEAARGTLSGVHAPIAQLIRTEDRYALAVETALGGAMGDIIVDTQRDGKNVIEMLKRRNAGRVTCQPIDVVRPQRLNREPSGETGYVGICADLVECDARFRDILSHLLGRTAVVETLTDAIRIARSNNNSFRIVTLDGQVLSPGGSMTGGSAARGTGILSRANELSKLRTDVEALEKKLSDTATECKEAERELEAARYDLSAARDELAAAQRETARLEGYVEQAKILRSAAEQALEDLEEELRTSGQRQKENRERTEGLLNERKQKEAELASVQEAAAEETAGLKDMEQRRAELEEKFSSIRASEASLNAEKGTVELAVRQLEDLRLEMENQSGERRGAMETVRSKNEEIKASLQDREERAESLHKLAHDQKEHIDTLTGRRFELEGRRSAADKAAQEKNRELLDLERNSALLEQKKLSSDMEEKQLVDKLWDSYELSRTEAEKVRQPVESLSAAGKAVSDLRRRMNALGNPNLGAIEEYERVSERYNFLSEQRDDVQRSKDEILNIIQNITGQMEEIFVRAMEEIDAAFRQTFVELFGGGKAKLSLEDENDVLNCGIDIRIQPPGKAVSNISLLSGGEKAFVAIALYFAIMKVRPTPFCVMDEIESALDEENVQRYAQYMRRMCSHTQFIAITHRRGTMDEADQLYGVTMQEKGVSTVISMDMDEALRTMR